MGEIHVQEFITLDGVIDQPGFTMRYPWEHQSGLGARLRAVTDRCDAILLGGTTFQMFAPVWSSRTVEEDQWAPFYCDSTKYVVSESVADPESVWANSVGLGAYDPGKIAALKDEVGDLFVIGSGTLVRAMLADRLIDVLHLCIFPVTLGGGPRLFAEGAPPLTTVPELIEGYDIGVTYMVCRPTT